jgi:glycosyltransferase involved in cell wall biosynthesis
MNSAKHPMISIIVATYNVVMTLQQCISSIVGQAYENIELIIIDGGSTDGTVELLEINNHLISYWISESDKGIYNAWNKGLLQAKGEWICFIGADDFILDTQVIERIAIQLAMIPSNINVAYGQIMLLNNFGENLYAIGEPWGKVKERFKQIMSIPHPGLMHRRSLFEQNGNFDESFRIGGDYELLLRELKTADAVFIPDIITVGMRQGGLSSSPSNSIETLLEARRAQKMHGLPIPSLIWIVAITRVYFRLQLWNMLGEKRGKKLIDWVRKISGLPAYWTKI